MSPPATPQDKPDAFILTGSFPVISRDPLYLAELRRRGLVPLVITSAAYRDKARAQIGAPGSPMAAIADIAFVHGDVTVEGSFVAGAIAAVTTWRQRYNIVGAYAVGDVLAEATGLLCDGLGVPGPGLRTSRTCRVKYLQRWYLPEFSPRFAVIPAAERDVTGDQAELSEGVTRALAGVGFPAVVKPASRHSSWGVQTVRGLTELKRELTAYPPHEIVLVEERVEGQEYSVESLVRRGEIVFASVTRKQTNETQRRTFVELSHTVPEPCAAAASQLTEANAVLLDRLGFGDGSAHSEWRITADGRVVLMEVAARTPGGGIMALYRLATGVPLEPEILNVALGEPASYPSPRRYARQVYLEHEAGVLEDVEVAWPDVTPQWIGEGGVWPEIKPGPADDDPALRAVLVLKHKGSELVPLSSADDRAVTFFIDAATPQQLDELEARVRQAISIQVRR
jgi:ATP-grasp domain